MEGSPAGIISRCGMETLFDFRGSRLPGKGLPEGKCIYLQAGDPSDFDGYFIAAAANALQQKTADAEVVIVVPERRVWGDRDEADLLKHDHELSEALLDTAGSLLRHLCPHVTLLRGLLNQRNLIPWSRIFDETAKYGPVLGRLPKVHVDWKQLSYLKDRILSDQVTSVVMDMNGSLGYLDGLLQRLGPEGRKVLGSKMRAAGLPVVIMAGVQAKLSTAALPLPGRDPRSTMNAAYYPDAVRQLLGLAREADLPLLFCTNNAANRLMRFNTAEEVAEALGLRGLLRGISDAWYGVPHLQGKCVPFDWVSFCAMLLYGREQQQQQRPEGPPLLITVRQQLYVDEGNAAVLVLRDPSKQPDGEGDELAQALAANLAGTTLWGEVESVVDVDREVMLRLAEYVSRHSGVSGCCCGGGQDT